MSTDEHARHEQNPAAYLLGSLSELERQAFERHLARCEDCRRELDELRPAVEALPRSVPPVAPPPSLKASLMETVEREATPRRRPRRRWRVAVPRPALAWAATLAVGVAVGIGVADLGGDADGPRTIAAQGDRARLAGAEGGLTIADGRGSAVLRVSGMPRLAAGQTYQLWLRRGDRVVPQGLFGVDGSGRGSGAITASLADADAVMVTREPTGGSAAPSERPVMTVRF